MNVAFNTFSSQQSEALNIEQFLDVVLADSQAARACLTCSFQAEDVIVLDLLRKRLPQIPVLFLETGYHFAATYEFRDRWRLAPAQQAREAAADAWADALLAALTAPAPAPPRYQPALRQALRRLGVPRGYARACLALASMDLSARSVASRTRHS